MEKFKKIETEIEDACILKPKVFEDNRGYFMETYNQGELKELGINYNFVQDNQSKSKQGVLRGLHFQTENTQGKLVRVIKGAVFDVAVDLRRKSKTYGKWIGVELTDENKKIFFIPPYFAHGFLVLSKEAEFTYKCTDKYNPKAESGIIYNDPNIGIKWPKLNCKIITSEKDKKHQTLEEFTKSKIWQNKNDSAR